VTKNVPFSDTQHSEQIKFVGPEKGRLILVGGGFVNKVGIQKFLELTGKESKILVIPTAGDDSRQNEKFYSAMINLFKESGASAVEMLHTRDTSVANSVSFLNKIKEAKGVWFLGGNPANLTKAFLNTKVMEELQNLLNRDGVIGGNSAGANVMGSYFLRFDEKTKKFEPDNRGFQFVQNACIIPHLLKANRQYWFPDFNKYNPGLLGIGISDDAFAVIHQNELEVFGSNCIAIYDGSFQTQVSPIEILPKNSERFYFLSEGAKYDLKDRKVIQFAAKNGSID